MGKFSNNIKKAKLFGSIGQSNEDSRGEDSNLLTPYRDAIINSHVFYSSNFINANNGSWQTLQYNENNFYKAVQSSPLTTPESNAFHGSELFLAYDYIEATGNDFWLCKMGRGGTDINGTTVPSWQKDTSGSLIVRYYEWLLKPAIQALVDDGYYVDLEGVFFFQGASDTTTIPFGEAYEFNGNDLFTYFRGRLNEKGYEDVMIYIQESPDWKDYPSVLPQANNDIRAAQLAIASQPNFTFLPNTNYIHSFKEDKLHVNSIGHKSIASQRLEKIKNN